MACADMGLAMDGCDPWTQDCPEGQKCTVYNTEGSIEWNATKCIDVTGIGQPGEVCTHEDDGSDIDSCVKGAICLNYKQTGVGNCVALCTGSLDAPVCDDMIVCMLASENSLLALCRPTCDPLSQECPNPNEGCYPFGGNMNCFPDASGDEGQANDPCTLHNECDKGLLCGAADFIGAGCTKGISSCCTPFCEFPDGVCPNPDQQCIQWFDPMNLPDPNLANLGACGAAA
jgi:hypothetical protein